MDLTSMVAMKKTYPKYSLQYRKVRMSNSVFRAGTDHSSKMYSNRRHILWIFRISRRGI